MIRLRADSDRLRRTLRRREIEAVFQGVPDDTFEDALELGAGDGVQSQYIARCARKVLCTDLNADRLERVSHPKLTYDISDAEALPYDTGRFDLIYSSNLIEHLPNPEKALSEMRRVLRNDGVMLHVVPNRFWKLLHLGLFYPRQVVFLLETVLSGGRVRTDGEEPSRGNNLKSERPSFLRRNLWPAVHGEYAGHAQEFVRMGASYLNPRFLEAGFETVGWVDGLPAHSPYRFGLEIPRKICEGIGLSSCNGYILTKTGETSSALAALMGSGK